MDSLSIAASIAGIITLADTAFGALVRYAKTANKAQKESGDLAWKSTCLAVLWIACQDWQKVWILRPTIEIPHRFACIISKSVTTYLQKSPQS